MNTETLRQINSITFSDKKLTSKFIDLESDLHELTFIYRSIRCLETDSVVKDYRGDETHFTYYCYYTLTTFTKIFAYYQSIGRKSITIFDFGCGAGILMRIVKKLGQSFDLKVYVHGCDIYDYYVKLANTINYENKGFIKLDMTKITKKSFDFDKVDLFYFWNPLRDPKMINQFVTRFSKIVNDKQLIYYIPADSHFHDKMRETFEFYVELFCKKERKTKNNGIKT